MTTPIDPEMCMTTGRLLTEWFEYPEYTDEQIREEALKHNGVDEWPEGDFRTAPPETAEIIRKLHNFVAGRKNRKFKNGMSNQEVQHRMNEASKMVNPDNFKFLPDDVRERTGLEVNPLWMMECLVRSGVLNAKESVGALKELAQYTHSKAPSVNHNTNTELKPEDWLLELAKEEYQVIDHEAVQPKQPVERGASKGYENRLQKRAEETQALADFGQSEREALESEFDWNSMEIDEDNG